MPNDQPPFPPFSAPYAPDDRKIVAGLLQTARLEQAGEQRVDHTATRLIEAIRANDDPLGGVEDMLREFALSTKEGLALMVLAPKRCCGFPTPARPTSSSRTSSARAISSITRPNPAPSSSMPRRGRSGCRPA